MSRIHSTVIRPYEVLPEEQVLQLRAFNKWILEKFNEILVDAAGPQDFQTRVNKLTGGSITVEEFCQILHVDRRSLVLVLTKDQQQRIKKVPSNRAMIPMEVLIQYVFDLRQLSYQNFANLSNDLGLQYPYAVHEVDLESNI